MPCQCSLHSREPYVKVWRRAGASSVCFKCTWIRGWEENEIKRTWTTSTELKKKEKGARERVQNLCNVKSLHESADFSLLCFCLSQQVHSFLWVQKQSLHITWSLPHTIESLISEPSRTRGRGHVGEISTWLSLKFRGLFSDSEKLLLLSGDEHSCGGVLQM